MRGSVCRLGAWTIALIASLALGSAARAWALDAEVDILSPTAGATVSGSVAVKASLGPDAWWARLKIDGSTVASGYSTFTWNSAGVSNSTHTLTVDSFVENGVAPVASESITVTVNNASGSMPVYFTTRALGTTLPGESWCAANIPATPEAISGNSAANSRTPSSSDLAGFYAGEPEAGVPAWYLNRVDGNYTGSTDMILRWAACKWGVDENVVRAQAWGESAGMQTSVGDWTGDSSLCPPGSGFPGAWNGSSCGQSYGILQVKYPYQTYTWPMIQTSTAFNVDYRFAIQWACMNGNLGYLAERTPDSGYPTYPNGTLDQMLWGCIGQWYSGGWYDDGALAYIDYIQTELSKQPWK